MRMKSDQLLQIYSMGKRLRVPMRERLKSREHVGPYYWTPAKPGGGRSFYQHSKFLACGDSVFDLRLELANDHLEGRQSRIEGYWCDEFQDSVLTLLWRV